MSSQREKWRTSWRFGAARRAAAVPGEVFFYAPENNFCEKGCKTARGAATTTRGFSALCRMQRRREDRGIYSDGAAKNLGRWRERANNG